MKIPQTIWNEKMQNGVLLSDFVENTDPIIFPLSDITAFTNVWKQRLVEGVDNNLPEYTCRAQNILNFIEKHKTGFFLLMWPRWKLGLVFSPSTSDYLLLDSPQRQP